MFKRYLMLSNNTYIDLDSWKLLTKTEKSSPNKTYIPEYFWYDDIVENFPVGMKMENGKLVNSYSNSNIKTDVITLNNIKITLNGWFSANINFYDSATHKRYNIDIKGRSISGRFVVPCVELTMTYDGNVAVFMVDLTNKDNFKAIGSLANQKIKKEPRGTIPMNYGVLRSQYSIEYSGMVLEGKCYAYLNGVWGILLKDDLSFDALVTFKGYNRSKLIIDRIIYTSNAYLVKVMMLKR